MAVDPYAPCPCGSGKKLKFCCADLAADIEKIDKLATSDQPHAALGHVEKLLAKEPDRASLLDIRAMLELSLHEFDAAEKTLQHFLVTHPDNASAHAQAAMLAAARGETLAAVARLQDALERTDNAMPRRVFEAIGAVGHALSAGWRLRGRAGPPAAVRRRRPRKATTAPSSCCCGSTCRAACRCCCATTCCWPRRRPTPATSARSTKHDAWRQRGLWRRAEAEFAKLLDDAHPQPPVVYNLALVRGWLGDTAQFAAGLHHFAQLDVPLDDAVEAEALAQLVDPKLEEPTLESVRITYPVPDDDAAAERLAADKRIEPYELDPETLDEDEVTRPRSTHILLDRAPHEPAPS